MGERAPIEGAATGAPRKRALGFGTIATLAVAFCLAVAPAGAHDTTGKSTVEQTIEGDGSAGFQFLRLAGGEPYAVRDDLAPAQAGREDRRLSVFYLGQITDWQIPDEESPAREERFDSEPFQRASTSGHRPQEALAIQQVEASVRQLNRFLESPVPQGDGTRAPMLNAVMTGDLADSMQRNETEWVRTLLEGGPINPGSGTSNYEGTICAALPDGVTVADGDDPSKYTGVQDYDDYGVDNPMFYDPESPAGAYASDNWPTYPKLLDRAQRPFEAAGLKVPTYVAFGNHDALYQGTVSAGPGIVVPTLTWEDMAVGCLKPVYPLANENSVGPPPDPADLFAGLLSGDVIAVPPDIDRQYVDKRQFKDIFHAGSQGDAHGFAHIDPDEAAASNDQASYYSFSPKDGVRYIVLDTVSESGLLQSPGFDGEPAGGETGNIDHPQWQWLQEELDEAEQENELIVLFGHHNAKSLRQATADEVSPCLGAQLGVQQFGHDRFNPSCDRDPRTSTPVHSGEEFTELLHGHPNVIAYVAGHTHENEILPFANPEGGGYWEITSPAIADWPPQSRLIEVMDNDDGTLSIFTTLIDEDAPSESPPSGTDADAAAFGVDELASIGRTLNFNDPQVGQTPDNVGQPIDRNAELLVPDPRKSGGDGGNGSGKGGGAPGSPPRSGKGCRADPDARLVGTRGRDELIGGGRANLIRGRRGKDRIRGRGGDDCLFGGRGRDRIAGGGGDDLIGGGGGADRLKGGRGTDVIRGGRGFDRINAADGERDVVRCGKGVDRVVADRKDALKGCERVRRVDR